MADLSSITPKTLAGIKQLAKKLKRDKGYSHAEGLNEAAKQAGYENFAHARKSLEAV